MWTATKTTVSAPRNRWRSSTHAGFGFAADPAREQQAPHDRRGGEAPGDETAGSGGVPPDLAAHRRNSSTPAIGIVTPRSADEQPGRAGALDDRPPRRSRPATKAALVSDLGRGRAPGDHRDRREPGVRRAHPDGGRAGGGRSEPPRVQRRLDDELVATAPSASTRRTSGRCSTATTQLRSSGGSPMHAEVAADVDARAGGARVRRARRPRDPRRGPCRSRRGRSRPPAGASIAPTRVSITIPAQPGAAVKAAVTRRRDRCRGRASAKSRSYPAATSAGSTVGSNRPSVARHASTAALTAWMRVGRHQDRPAAGSVQPVRSRCPGGTGSSGLRAQRCAREHRRAARRRAADHDHVDVASHGAETGASRTRAQRQEFSSARSVISSTSWW